MSGGEGAAVELPLAEMSEVVSAGAGWAPRNSTQKGLAFLGIEEGPAKVVLAGTSEKIAVWTRWATPPAPEAERRPKRGAEIAVDARGLAVTAGSLYSDVRVSVVRLCVEGQEVVAAGMGRSGNLIEWTRLVGVANASRPDFEGELRKGSVPVEKWPAFEVHSSTFAALGDIEGRVKWQLRRCEGRLRLVGKRVGAGVEWKVLVALDPAEG